MYYQEMEMEFRVSNGSKVVLRGMINGSHGLFLLKEWRPFLDMET